MNNNPLLQNLKNQANNKKKINNLNSNSSFGNNNNNAVKQPPLEIINELNADASKESFYDSSSFANKIKNQENPEIKIHNEVSINNINNNQPSHPNNFNEETNKINHVLKVESELHNNINNHNHAFDNSTDKENNMNDYKDNNIFNHGIIGDNNNLRNNFDSKNYNSENIEIPMRELHMNDDANNNQKNLNDMQKNYSSHQINKNNQPTQTRNKKSLGTKEERWKNIKITSIVAERILLSNQEGIFTKL